MIPGVRWVVLAVAVACIVAPAAERVPTPITVEMLLELADIRQVELSPDGRSAVVEFADTRPDYAYHGGFDMRDALRTRLVLSELESGRVMHPPGSDEESSNAAWSPDGRQVAFQRGLGAGARLWVWNVVDGSTRQVSGLEPRRLLGRATWLPDGKRVICPVVQEDISDEERRELTGYTGTASDYPLDTPVPGARVAVYRAGPGEGAAPSRQQFAQNNLWRSDLAVIDVATGAHRRLAAGHRPVRHSLSPDGSRVAFVDAIGQAEGSGYRNLYDVYVVDVAGGASRRLVRDACQIGTFMEVTWSPDGRWLAFADSGPGGKNQVSFVDVSSGEIREVSLPVAHNRLVPPRWDRAGGQIYLLVDEGLACVSLHDAKVELRVQPSSGPAWIELVPRDDSGCVATTGTGELLMLTCAASKDEAIVAVDPVTGSTRMLHGGAFSFRRQFTRVAADGSTWCFVRQGAGEPPQAWVADAGFQRLRAITRLDPAWERLALGRGQLMEWRGLEGQPMQGALLVPPGPRPPGGWPVVVYLYGDAALSNDLNKFGFNDHATMPYDNMQLLATRGIAVLRPDTRTRVGTPMTDLAACVLPALDRLVDSGIADQARLGVMGRSYGGYSVMALLVQTGRFKAAVAVCGQSNLLGVYREMEPAGTNWKISWAEENQGKIGGTPWNRRERYIENSPFFFLDRLTTPLLIVHGTEDTAVAIEAGDETFLALRRLGKTVEYAKYLGEPHVILGRPNAIDYGKRMIAWFERHL